MKFQTPLIAGKLVKRYKRFLADIELTSGEVITVHCPNPGSMKTCQERGWGVMISDSQNPKRKLRYTWELVHNGKCWICINTNRANAIAEEGILLKQIKELTGYNQLKREVKYGEKSRIDILLSNDNQQCFVEVKSVTLLQDGIYQFPDSVTSRGLKHLNELISQVEQGHRAVMLYLIQRSDSQLFQAAKTIDLKYANALEQAHEKGVEILCYQTKISPEEIIIDQSVPFAI